MKTILKFMLTASLAAAPFAAGDLKAQTAKEICCAAFNSGSPHTILLCPQDINLNAFCAAPPPPPPPPPPVGSDDVIQPPPADAGFVIPPITPSPDDDIRGFRPDRQAFTMIGDSRTHYIVGWKAWGPGNLRWWKNEILGQYRTGCSAGKTEIQNLALGGTTARDWAQCANSPTQSYLTSKGPITCRWDQMNHRVVMMIGGNDILNTLDSNPWKVFSHHVRAHIANGIHDDVKRIVNFLRRGGKEVIIQKHFGTNPAERSIEADLLLVELNARLEKDYNQLPYYIIPPRIEITGWRSHCFHVPTISVCRPPWWQCGWFKSCSPRFCIKPVRWCIPIPKIKFIPPQIVFRPVDNHVSLAQMPFSWPSGYFSDKVHQNPMGFQYHASRLKHALHDRCWW